MCFTVVNILTLVTFLDKDKKSFADLVLVLVLCTFIINLPRLSHSFCAQTPYFIRQRKLSGRKLFIKSAHVQGEVVSVTNDFLSHH